MNIYVTSESSAKIQNLIMNIKNFFIFDVQEFINNFNLDVSKPANIYLINNEITNTILSASKLKKYQGIIYINTNLTENLYYSLKKKFGNDEHIDKFVSFEHFLIVQVPTDTRTPEWRIFLVAAVSRVAVYTVREVYIVLTCIGVVDITCYTKLATACVVTTRHLI